MKKLLLLFVSALLLLGCERKSQNQNTSSNDQPVAQPEVEIVEQPEDEVEDVELAVLEEGTLPIYVLSDEYGEKFLIINYFGSEKNPQPSEELKNYKYVLYDGAYYPVVFKGFQLEDEANNSYRDTYFNFDNLPGWLFEMESGKLLENPLDDYDAIWDAPLLVDEQFKAENVVYTLTNTPDGYPVRSDLSKALQTAFEERYGRKIFDGWCGAIFGENNEYQFVVIQFENKGTEALGVSALVKNGEIVAAIEQPAEWNEESVWRVDDGGEYGGISVDFATSKDGVLTLYTANYGAEGTTYQTYVLEGNELVPGMVSADFYQAPM